MEAAGLSISILSLVGVFKDCVDLWALIGKVRSADREYELLDTKFDIEKTLLLQWAKRLRLVHPPQDPRLNNIDTQESVFKILSNIRTLLADGSVLHDKYGLQQLPYAESPDPFANRLSNDRLKAFEIAFRSLSLKTRQPISSTLKKVRWAIEDKDKFLSLVKDLSYFRVVLNEIVPDVRIETVAMSGADVRGALTAEKLNLIIEASSGNAEYIANAAKERLIQKCREDILQGLWYSNMDLRKESVSHSHEKTFHWVLRQPRPNDEWDDLSKWLTSDSGVYWVAGKAGSGKSTLMKYLYYHAGTNEYLKKWAQDGKWNKASFFFWRLGTEEQKSQVGLFRAILYQILHDDPRALAEQLLPRIWKQVFGRDNVQFDAPSEAEMISVARRIAQCTALGKTCVFIDGLDEFSGDPSAAIAFIKVLADVGSKIKVVVSSRPEPLLLDTFSTGPKLRLEDLTREDIAAYTEETLGRHTYMQKLLLIEPGSDSKLVTTIVQKSSGVFLWVILACRSLLNGFAAYDRISELQKRVDELPKELEELFQHMLGKVETRYHGQAARLLKLCYMQQTYGSAIKQNFVPLLPLALFDQTGLDSTKGTSFRLHTIEQKRRECIMFEGRLRSRCGGLLEICRRSETTRSYDTSSDFGRSEVTSRDYCFCGYSGSDESFHDRFLDSHVTFMHRTVYDFLDKDESWNLPCLQLEDPNFDYHAYAACLALHSASLHSGKSFVRFGQEIAAVTTHTSQISGSASEHIHVITSGLEHVLDRARRQTQIWGQTTWMNKWSPPRTVLCLGVEAGVVSIVAKYRNTGSLRRPEEPNHYPLLYHAIAKPICKALMPQKPAHGNQLQYPMIHFLLSRGSDLSESFMLHGKISTPWDLWLASLGDWEDPAQLADMANVTEDLLRFRGENTRLLTHDDITKIDELCYDVEQHCCINTQGEMATDLLRVISALRQLTTHRGRSQGAVQSVGNATGSRERPQMIPSYGKRYHSDHSDTNAPKRIKKD